MVMMAKTSFFLLLISGAQVLCRQNPSDKPEYVPEENSVAIKEHDRLRGPVIVSVGSRYFAAPGDQVSLPCSVLRLGSLVRLWKRGARVIFAGGLKVRKDPRLEVSEDGDLVIRGFLAEDVGEYDCELETDTDIPVYIRHSLALAQAPDISTRPRSGHLTITQGTDSALECVTTGQPPPRVTWYRLGPGARSEVTTSARGQRLELTNITRHQEGLYRCEAENGVGQKAVDQIKVSVAYPPMLRTEASVVYTGLGQRFYLACHVSAEPPADVTWTRQNRHVHVSRRMPRVELVRREDTWFLFLNNVTSEDFGEYVCRANNTIGTSSTNVIVVGSPKPPQILRIRRVDPPSSITTSAPLISDRGLGGQGEAGLSDYEVSWATKSFSPLLGHRLLVKDLEMPRLAGGDWRILEIPMAPPSARPAPLTTRFTYLLTNLTSNSSYSLMIRSRNYLGWSKLSEKVTFDTFPSPESPRSTPGWLHSGSAPGAWPGQAALVLALTRAALRL